MQLSQPNPPRSPQVSCSMIPGTLALPMATCSKQAPSSFVPESQQLCARFPAPCALQVHMDTPAAQANISSLRGPFYKRAYQQVTDSLADEGALRGRFRACALRWGQLLTRSNPNHSLLTAQLRHCLPLHLLLNCSLHFTNCSLHICLQASSSGSGALRLTWMRASWRGAPTARPSRSAPRTASSPMSLCPPRSTLPRSLRPRPHCPTANQVRWLPWWCPGWVGEASLNELVPVGLMCRLAQVL